MSSYPPEKFLEYNLEKLHLVIEEFKFATMISSDIDGLPVISQVPLILDRSKKKQGVLFGHFDKNNPHVKFLDKPNIALFHGPNAYISPTIFESEQLPTWNYITVQVEGKISVIREEEKLIKGLISISEHCDPFEQKYVLEPDNPKIACLLDYIVGFEIEITDIKGRFKLLQDRAEVDRQIAENELIRQSELGSRQFIEKNFGSQSQEESL